jgi:hypothetical protein
MPTRFVESEYDMDEVVKEAISLVKLTDSTLDVGFHNKKMVKIFLDNFHQAIHENHIEPGPKNFMLNIMINESDEQT